MPTIGQAKATLVDKIDSLTAAATAKDTIYLAKALKENTSHHSFTFQGAWAATTAYALDDVVTNGGNTYICIAAHTSGASFSVGSNWSMMAGKGTDGAAGTNGTNGTNGTDVGTGTAGQVLKTNAAGNGIEWGAGNELVQFKYFDLGKNSFSTNSYSPQLVATFNYTPKKATNKLLVTLSHQGYFDPGHNDQWCRVSITKDSTDGGNENVANIALARNIGERHGTANHIHYQNTYQQVSDANTTNSVTLRVYWWNVNVGGRTSWFHRTTYDRNQNSFFTVAEYEI